MTALMLLSPGTPMLFQGQEFSASAPFLYFADFEPDLNAAVRTGRAEFLDQFPSLCDPEIQTMLADPASVDTFNRCKLDLRERESHREAYALHRDLLRLRREEPVFSATPFAGLDGAVVSPSAFALRFFTPDHREDRVLFVNLGGDIVRGSIAEPLLAPPADGDWSLRWSSEQPMYGGGGTPDIFADGCWRIPAECALFLTPGRARPRQPKAVLRRTA